MGMQSGAILDSQLSASSFSDLSSAEQTRFMIGTGWTPDPEDKIPWFKVNFMRLTVVMGTQVAGKVSVNHFDKYICRFHIVD